MAGPTTIRTSSLGSYPHLRPCEWCGQPILPREKESPSHYARRILCSRRCLSAKGGSKPKSAEHIEKVAAASRGRRHTPEARLKMVAAQKNRPAFVSDEHRRAFMQSANSPTAILKAKKTWREKAVAKRGSILSAGCAPCVRCGATKTFDKFRDDRRCVTGKHGVCRDCENSDARARRKIAPIPYHRSSAQVALRLRISNLLRYHLLRQIEGGKRGRGTWELLGYGMEVLKGHIERQFSKGMSWDKYVRGEIHIDHIIPASSFSYTDVNSPGFRACWALTNLQPLWAADNFKKLNKRVSLL